MAEETYIVRPKPLRPPSFTVTSTSTPTPPTPQTPADASSETFITRTRSVLNLTSSTLFGIYAPTESDEGRSTPWLAGSQTPLPRASMDEDRQPPVIGSFEKTDIKDPPRSRTYLESKANSVAGLGLRTVLLFGFGVAYGVIISQLHDSRKVAPVQVEGLARWSWNYLMGWGAVAVVLGGITPWFDVLWDEALGNNKNAFQTGNAHDHAREKAEEEFTPSSSSGLGADWNPIVRSIGAFVGIAFAIRKLPWQSTSQVSLTLALVNPVLWYLVDRSMPGFVLSAFVGLAGTAVVFGVNPDIVPSPAASSPRAVTGTLWSLDNQSILRPGLISSETVGVTIWVASVLFCSSVCFGNIGRRLSWRMRERRTSIS